MLLGQLGVPVGRCGGHSAAQQTRQEDAVVTVLTGPGGQWSEQWESLEEGQRGDPWRWILGGAGRERRRYRPPQAEEKPEQDSAGSGRGLGPGVGVGLPSDPEERLSEQLWVLSAGQVEAAAARGPAQRGSVELPGTQPPVC